MALPKPLQAVAPEVDYLLANGCDFRIEEAQFVIDDPNKILTNEPERKEFITANKIAILAYLQRRALLALLRVLEMAQPQDIKEGLKEDYIFALTAGVRLTGDIWDEDEQDPLETMFDFGKDAE